LGEVINLVKMQNAISNMDGYTTAHDNSVEVGNQFEFDEDLLSLGTSRSLVLDTIDTVFADVVFQEVTSESVVVTNDLPNNVRNSEKQTNRYRDDYDSSLKKKTLELSISERREMQTDNDMYLKNVLAPMTTKQT
jgi:hypothetical protein